VTKKRHGGKMTRINRKPRALIYLSIMIALLLLVGCNGAQTPRAEPGLFVLVNNSEQDICGLYFAPNAQAEQEFDVLDFAADTGQITAGDTFRVESADYAGLSDDVAYGVRAESCDGHMADTGGTLAFSRGMVWTIDEW
jgi:hypothetical protein